MFVETYHAHIYFIPQCSSHDYAKFLRDEIEKSFPTIKLGRIHETLVGSHMKPMFLAEFHHTDLSNFLPWLMKIHGNLSVLIHPETGDTLQDHTQYAMWLGQPLPISVESLK